MILITGATGNIGRALVHDLVERGADLRLLVRDPARATTLPDRAERVVADLAEPDSLPAAFAGVDQLFLLTQGIGTDQAENAVTAARAAGVGHIVLLSSAHVLFDPAPAMARWHQAREQIVRDSGIPTSFVRPGAFMTNALDWIPTIRAGGYVLDPTGPGRLAPVDPADIAAVAAAVLTDESLRGRDHTPTGDEPLTVAEQVRVIAETIGRPIEVRTPPTPEDAVLARFPHGAPPALAAAVLEAFALVRNDEVGFRTDDVEKVLGRPPKRFADWCARNADAFRAAGS